MKSTIRKVDRSLKRLYGLSDHPNAEDFLVHRLSDAMRSVLVPEQKGALLLQLSKTESALQELKIGIYLSGTLHKELSSFHRWTDPWTSSQLSAFTVAIEEVSHFHLLNYHLQRGAAVRQIELETQGEIDKFLLLYFATYRQGSIDRHFSETFERLFAGFSIHASLQSEQKQRYEEASRLAGRFVYKHRKEIQQCLLRAACLQRIRNFYRLNYLEKMRLIDR